MVKAKDKARKWLKGYKLWYTVVMVVIMLTMLQAPVYAQVQSWIYSEPEIIIEPPPPSSPGPGDAILNGTVNLSAGASLLDPVNLVVRFFTPNTTSEVMRACSPTNVDGNFTIYGITPGTYDVGVKSDNSLSILIEDKVFTGSNTTEIDFSTLKRGDVNNDDYVTSADRSILYLYWGQGGDCWNYTGDWLMPECPAGIAVGEICYGYIIG